MKHFAYALIIFGFVVAAGAQTYSPGLPLPGLPKSVGPKPSTGSTSITFATDQYPVAITGTLTANNTSVSPTGLAVPPDATYVGMNVAGNLTGITGSALGLIVNGSGYTQPVYIKNSEVPLSVTAVGSIYANQGTPNSRTNGWPVKPTDGVNAQTFTAAGEAGVLLVNSLPSGNNVVGFFKPTDPSGRNQTFTASGEAGVVLTQQIPAGVNLIGSVKAQLQDNNGSAVTLGQKTSFSSIPVVLSSDSTAPREVPNSNGTNVVNTSINIGNLNFQPPANAVGFLLQAADTNTANVRWLVGPNGSSVTTTAGNQLQPGRDTGYVPLASTISAAAESGVQQIQLQWVSQ